MQENKAKIRGLLKSPERKNWMIAILGYREGGFSIEDAWRWFVFGMFASAGLDSGGKCGNLFYNTWIGGDCYQDFEFGGVKLRINAVAISNGEEHEYDLLSMKVDIANFNYKKQDIKFHYHNIDKYIPKTKPYCDYEGPEGNMQAYFYAVLSQCLGYYKEKIIQVLHIDKDYIAPVRKKQYQNSLFPLDQ